MLEEESAIRVRVSSEQAEATADLKSEMASLDDDLERFFRLPRKRQENDQKYREKKDSRAQ